MPELLLRTPKVGKDAPDPSLGGPIRNIVKSAHKWGGNGTEPKFEKIKSVLLAKHPEVIAKAFGGDPNKAAAWIKDNWRAMHGQNPWSWRKGGSKKGTVHAALNAWYDMVPESSFDAGAVELFMDAGDIELEGDLLYMPICKTGTWKVSPLPGNDPLVIDKGLFDDVVTAFKEGAWEHVTVPLSHKDKVNENTGFVKELDVRADPTRDGEYKLYAGVKFTEADIKAKVENRSIAGSSVGIAMDGITRTRDGKHFPRVLKHVALTNQPWIDGLYDGEELAASQAAYEIDEAPDMRDLEPLLLSLSKLDLDQVVPLSDSDDATGEPDASETDANVLWDSDDDWMAIEAALRTALRGYYYDDDQEAVVIKDSDFGANPMPKSYNSLSMKGVQDGKCLVVAGWDNQTQGWIAPYTYEEGEANLSSPADWKPVESAWLAASQGSKSVGDMKKGDKFKVKGKKLTHMGPHPSKKSHSMVKPEGKAPMYAVSNTTPVDSGFAVTITDVDSIDELQLKQFTAGERKTAAKKGQAMPGGGFPIENESDLKNAIQAVGRASDPAAAKAHIRKRAKALGLTNLLPDSWKSDMNAGNDPSKGGVNMPLELTKEELDQQVEDRVNAAIKERDAQWEARLSKSEERAHTLECERLASKLEDDGHAPAVIEFAKEVMLADARATDVLTLSRDGEGDDAEPQEYKLSATDIVINTLDRVKAAKGLSLAKRDDQPRVPRIVPDGAKGPDVGDGESLDDKVARLSTELHDGPVLQLGG